MVHLSAVSHLAVLGIHGLFAHFRMPLQDNYYLWKTIGYAGMTLFFSRFLVQWLYSERHQESKIPVAFWWQSLFGSVLMLAYSLRQRDSVYILGYLVTAVPYVRNLILIYRKPRESKPTGFPVAPQAPARPAAEVQPTPASFRSNHAIGSVSASPAHA